LWILFHEANEEYPNEYISQTIGANTRFAGQSELGYTGDPYSIHFVSFFNRGPVRGLSLYQRLEQMRESGMLDSMAGKFEDHRISFAYPEWYDRDVAKWYDISRELTLPRPPRLDIGRVDKPEYTEGEKRNYIKTNGLDAYIWHGTMWDDYEYSENAHTFDGWERQIDGLTFRQLQRATPDEDLKARWLAGQAAWEDVVDTYAENLTDREGLEITFTDPEDAG
jgi:hypothetical protein